ncbi:IS1634 family transposase [Candidatus Woesearchaeota archaeon]|nr:IS1634 family transposase [Candidatus Woesearchaeota archaeon]
MTENTPFMLETENIGPLPIINHYMERLKIEETLLRHLDPANSQKMEPAHCISVLLRNIITEREPIYSLGEWAAEFHCRLFGLGKEQLSHINDDRVGRALDHLYDTDRASLLTELVVRAIIEFKLDTSQLHNDSTSLTFCGDYSEANGDNKRGKRSLSITNGHNKDHRPDLKQLLWILTATSDGAVPIHYRACDGNTTDSPTHKDTWNALRKILGRSDFLYVADCKLCTNKNLKYIASESGRFITVVPRSDKEDIWFRKHIQTNKVEWKDIECNTEKKGKTSKDKWRVVESPMRSADGFRVIWAWHSDKEEQDKTGRQKLMEKAAVQFEKLESRLCNSRTRLRSRDAIVEEAENILDGAVGRWMEYDITEEKKDSFRQAKRGRPGTQTNYKRKTKTYFHITWRQRENNIEYDAKSDGMFPLITNCMDMAPKEILDKYKYQPKLEKRHEQLKTVYGVTPVLLKSVTRIEGLLFVYFIAMLIQALIEREVRSRMKEKNTTSLPIYPEDRGCESPTTNAVLYHFRNIQVHRLWSENTLIQTFLTPISDKQRELLTYMDVPLESYTRLG